MVEELFELLDSLIEKQSTVNNILETLGGSENDSFLRDEIQKTELLIVKAFGGNEGHYTHIDSTDMFYNYEYYEIAGTKGGLIDYIKLTIENDWTEEVSMIIING
ncbi:MAG: hypothetical protein LPK26_01765 [Bacillaceae bacterium]|nr:hypothetical protein [Bacillaceae bacterium]